MMALLYSLEAGLNSPTRSLSSSIFACSWSLSMAPRIALRIKSTPTPSNMPAMAPITEAPILAKTMAVWLRTLPTTCEKASLMKNPMATIPAKPLTTVETLRRISIFVASGSWKS
uniref:Uncharacterized protein n=1 Tax=Gopherus agassizii TaxID=38772 RepID=A0A452H158_9SAUR